MNNQSPNPHHSRTSIIQFNSTLPHLCLITKFIPSKVQLSITVISRELGFNTRPWCLTVGNFGSNEECTHLIQDIHTILSFKKCTPRSHTIGNALSAGETNSSGSGKVSHNGKHGNTAVLDFLFTEVIE